MWGGADPAIVERTWAREMWSFEGVDLREALSTVGQNYPNYPPTLPQFVGLCRDARTVRLRVTMRLASPVDRVDNEFIARIVGGIGKGKGDSRDWARRIVAREESGERVPLIASQYAREALR